ncbi:protein FAM90A27P-like [Bos taurus]|uniref:protein FAM90A27P-like n=1 Tax=Bos taurus TaxID=9913 RepID=UPI0028CB9C76|nr:protein FAM90A27P-like [Bos taurus]
MDPSKLSMEQGKAFLQEIGIPQRDLDLMTEKWVVDASVEVLLRFPLLPGEDPAARCVPDKKCQPPVHKPHGAPQRPGVQEERKSNSQLPRKNAQKPQEVRQIKSHYIHQLPQRPTMAQNVKKLLRGPVERRTTFSDKNNKVKCRNCGAFGHLATSKWCPTKSWAGAVAPQPLGSKKKENLEPRRPQDIQAPTFFNEAVREQEPEPRQEVPQRNAVPQTHPVSCQGKTQRQEPEDLRAFMRQPTRPMPVQTSKRRPVLGPVLMGQPLAQIPKKR